MTNLDPPQEDPFEKYAEAGRELADLAKEIGLNMIHFAVQPAMDGSGRNLVQAVFDIDEESIGKTVEDRKMEAEMEKFRREIEQQEKDASLEAKAEELAKSFQEKQKRMEEGDGFL